MCGFRNENLQVRSVVVGGSCARDPFLWDATNKSVRFTVGNVSRSGFWRNWGVWGDRSPPVLIPKRGRGAGRGNWSVLWQRLMVLAGAVLLGSASRSPRSDRGLAAVLVSSWDHDAPAAAGRRWSGLVVVFSVQPAGAPRWDGVIWRWSWGWRMDRSATLENGSRVAGKMRKVPLSDERREFRSGLKKSGL